MLYSLCAPLKNIEILGAASHIQIHSVCTSGNSVVGQFNKADNPRPVTDQSHKYNSDLTIIVISTGGGHAPSGRPLGSMDLS